MHDAQFRAALVQWRRGEGWGGSQACRRCCFRRRGPLRRGRLPVRRAAGRGRHRPAPDRQRRGRAAGPHRVVRQGPPGARDQDRAARRLLGGRLRRGVRAGDARGPSRLGAGRGRRPPGLPPLGRVRRRPDPRPVPPDRQGPDDRAARRGDHGRRQRRHALPAALGVGAAARGRRAPAPGGRRRGRRGHLPRPRHHRADRAAAAAGRPAVVAPARRRPDDRDRRGRRPDRLARLGARSGVHRARRRCSSDRTGSTPRRPATPRSPRCCCPRCWPRSA